jgi:hypothetical protein
MKKRYVIRNFNNKLLYSISGTWVDNNSYLCEEFESYDDAVRCIERNLFGKFQIEEIFIN